MRKKQVKFNPYIYTKIKIVPFFGYEISVFNTQQKSRRGRRLIRQGNGFTEEWI